MSKIWPFAFFPGMKSSDTPKEEIPEEAVDAVEEVEAEEAAAGAEQDSYPADKVP